MDVVGSSMFTSDIKEMCTPRVSNVSQLIFSDAAASYKLHGENIKGHDRKIFEHLLS